MSSQHKTKLIGFNPDDGTLKTWFETRARELGVTAKSLYEAALTAYRQQISGAEQQKEKESWESTSEART